jgi:rubrerythrin
MRPEATMNVFDFALKMEEDGKAYYEKLAAESSTRELQEIFSLLADAERSHHAALLARKNGVPHAKAESTVLENSKNIFRKLLEMKEMHDQFKVDTDGYRHAIKAEEESISFYEKAAAKEENEDARNLLLMLAEEEKEHLSIIENIYEFVEAPRTYLAWGEFSNLKEL